MEFTLVLILPALCLNKLDTLLEVTDLIMLDIKHINPQKHKELTAHSNERILAFAKYLDEKHIPVWIRHVVVPGITLYKEYLEELGHASVSFHGKSKI